MATLVGYRVLRWRRQDANILGVGGWCGWQGDVVDYEGFDRCSLFDLNVFAVLDEADGAEEDGEDDHAGCAAFAFLAFCAAEVDLVVAYPEILEAEVQFSCFAQHAGLLCVGDLSGCFRAFSGDNDASYFRILEVIELGMGSR